MADYKNIKGFNIQYLDSDPPNPIEGQMWFNSTTQTLKGAEAGGADRHDPYTAAHLAQAKSRIQKALEADYILNPSSGGGGGGSFMIFGQETGRNQ